MKNLLAALALGAVSACSFAGFDYSPTHETSVKPGINESFFGSEVDVDGFVEKWEGESREVYVARSRIVQRADFRAGSVVADIGAGTGAFLADLTRAVGPTGNVLALDVAPAFVKHLEDRVASEKLSPVEVRLCAENSIELPPNSIDAAFICNVYHHFEFPRNSVASIEHALRAGGEVIIVDFERIEGQSREWVLDHVRCGKDTVFREMESFGFEMVEELEFPEFKETWVARFRRRFE